MIMMTFSSTATRNLGALASRTSSRHSSTLLRSATSTFSSSNATILSSSSPAFTSPINNNNNAINNTQSRSLSMAMPRRGFPQYTIFGPESALSLRAILPNFKRAGHDGVSVDRRGKLVLEFIPRNTSGSGFAWSDKTLFSLSVEEVGLCLSQLPENNVELSHATYGSGGGEEEDGGGMIGEVTQMGGDPVEKVLTIEPGEGATLKFKVDYMKGGEGGQTPPGIEGLPTTPLEVTIQAGEFEVLKSICQSSIPYLLGWNTTMDIASAAAISKGVSGNNHMY